jgi:magnesium-transporting ATPase (P-type)
VVAYTLSNSFAEVLLIFGATLLGWPAPLAVAQILWIHLICDGPSDIVLGFEPKEEGIMDEMPKAPNEPILDRLGLSLIGVISISSALIGLHVFGHYFTTHNSAVVGRSAAFASFAINSMIYIFAYRSMRRSILNSGPLSQNPPLVWSVLAGVALALGAFAVPGIRNLLGIVPLSLAQWARVFAVAGALLLTVEAGKWLNHRFSRPLTLETRRQ